MEVFTVSVYTKMPFLVPMTWRGESNISGVLNRQRTT